ncbi:chromosome segregation ATPase, partial [Striga asiatica]
FELKFKEIQIRMWLWRRTRYIHIKYRPQSLPSISTLHQHRANDLEEQLKCAENTAVALAERLKMKEDELLCLKSKANDLEEQLKCEENTAVAMAERLKMKEGELLCLKSKVNDLEGKVQVLSKRNIFRNRIVCMSFVLFVVSLFSLGKGENG